MQRDSPGSCSQLPERGALRGFSGSRAGALSGHFRGGMGRGSGRKMERIFTGMEKMGWTHPEIPDERDLLRPGSGRFGS